MTRAPAQPASTPLAGAAPDAFTPECPRCGYDLSGQVATWHPVGADEDGAGCPTTGTCSECGLDLSWSRVMRPDRTAPKWFYETSRWAVRGLAKTLVRVLWPVGFWRSVGLETPYRWGRVALLAGLVVVLACVDWMLLRLSFHVWMGNVIPPPTLGEFVSDMLGPMWPFNQSLLLLCVLVGVCWALMMVALPYTRADAKVRVRHVVRAGVYSQFWALGLIILNSISVAVQAVWTIIASLNLAGPGGRGMGAGIWRPPTLESLTNPPSRWMEVLVLGILAYLALYWWCVLRIGWRVRSPFVVWLASGFPALLAALTAMLMIEYR